MLDIRLIRRDPDRVVALRRGPHAAETIREVLDLDERWRGLTTELEQLRSEQNQASKALRGGPDPASSSSSLLQTLEWSGSIAKLRPAAGNCFQRMIPVCPSE